MDEQPTLELPDDGSGCVIGTLVGLALMLLGFALLWFFVLR
jgi:hypothetical protein